MKKYMKAAAAMMLMTAMALVTGCKPEEEPNNGGDHNGSGGTETVDFNGHDYVDLGLPSGILWATCNVGADAPEAYGNYFAWGETAPKTAYNWTTYRHCAGSAEKLTKYCSLAGYGNNGFTDGLTVLQAEDDAATAQWGKAWSVPTIDQWVELYKNCTCTWTIQNNVGGRLFTARNGKKLFLPAAGRLWDGAEESETGGYYWSSSLQTDYPNAAWSFYFDSGSIGKQDYSRAYGFLIRPVCASH